MRTSFPHTYSCIQPIIRQPSLKNRFFVCSNVHSTVKCTYTYGTANVQHTLSLFAYKYVFGLQIGLFVVWEIMNAVIYFIFFFIKRLAVRVGPGRPGGPDLPVVRPHGQAHHPQEPHPHQRHAVRGDMAEPANRATSQGAVQHSTTLSITFNKKKITKSQLCHKRTEEDLVCSRRVKDKHNLISIPPTPFFFPSSCSSVLGLLHPFLSSQTQRQQKDCLTRKRERKKGPL